mmetsp:Transcript_28167/g.32273  ORF Transcript_28167/g.32273 Transcript_28167/m.32273 type:complete len:93 (-) Transcript_28167:18-296(-)
MMRHVTDTDHLVQEDLKQIIQAFLEKEKNARRTRDFFNSPGLHKEANLFVKDNSDCDLRSPMSSSIGISDRMKTMSPARIKLKNLSLVNGHK